MIHHPNKGHIEKEYLDSGNKYLLGIDEVGRGCIAGPIYAASVILDYEKLFQLPTKELHLIRDSKKLSTLQRRRIVPVIKEVSLEYHVCSSTVREIEELGIVGANFRAMRRSIRKLNYKPCVVLLDGNSKIPRYGGRQVAIVGGDSLCYCISAASILAKEARDDYMKEKASEYPYYNLASNVGYGTKEHLDGIDVHGICPLHRRNFAPISNYIEVHS